MPDFDAFFRTHGTPVWNYLKRLTGDRERASDLFQRVFFKAYTHFETRRAGGSERSWIFTIATNEARDDVRRRRRDLLRPMEQPDAWTVPDPSPLVMAEDRELAREAMRAVDGLPPAQREIFLLVRCQGLSFGEAAEACGMGLSAAKMAVARAHERILRTLRDRIDLRSLL